MSGKYVLEKDGLLRQEILRESHHKMIHLEDTEQDFVKYCKKASQVVKSFFEDNTRRSKKDQKLRKQYDLEERNFQLAVRNCVSDTPVDVIYIEDIESGKVLIYDPPPDTDCQDRKNTTFNSAQDFRPHLKVSTKTISIYEYFPEGYSLRTHRKVKINRAIRRIMYRAKHLAKLQVVKPKSERPEIPASVQLNKNKLDTKHKKNTRSLSSSSSSSESSLSSICDSESSINLSATFYSESSDFSDGEKDFSKLTEKKKKEFYRLQTQIGDAIIQRRFESLKGKRNVIQDELLFYKEVCTLVETEKKKSAPRFKTVENPADYRKWVSGDLNLSSVTSHSPESTEKQILPEVPDFTQSAILNLLRPEADAVDDFHRAIAFVKEAQIYTLADVENKNVIFGGLKASCKSKNRKFPFQDVMYVFKNLRGEEKVNGLAQRKVDVLIPTVSLLPHMHPNLRLEFIKCNPH